MLLAGSFFPHDALDIASVETGNVVGERMRVQRDLGMGARAEVLSSVDADRGVAQRGAFGRASDDADVLCHRVMADSVPLARAAAPPEILSPETITLGGPLAVRPDIGNGVHTPGTGSMSITSTDVTSSGSPV